MEELPIEYDSLTDVEINQQMNKAEESIRQSELLIKNLRQSCKHKVLGVGIVNKTLRVVCQSCKGALGYPGEAEIVKAGYVV